METEEEMIDGGYFIEHDPQTGKPYIGFAVHTGGISLSIYMANKQSAKDTLATFGKAVDELLKTPDKVVPANASLRNP